MARLPTHLEISGWIRAIEAKGGFATVIYSGERDSGVVLILTTSRGKNTALWERMPQLDGSRTFIVIKEQDSDSPEEFTEYLERRKRQDPDLWVLEIDAADAAQLVETVVN